MMSAVYFLNWYFGVLQETFVYIVVPITLLSFLVIATQAM